MTHWRPLALLLGAALLTACAADGDESVGARQDPSAPTAALVMADSVALQETDSLYIGSPAGLTIDAVGNVYVADAMSGHVLAFSPAGGLLRRFGKQGEGPGELATPISVAVVGDSLLAVAGRGQQPHLPVLTRGCRLPPQRRTGGLSVQHARFG